MALHPLRRLMLPDTADRAITQWLGESRGHWDGDTLVIETANFNAESPMMPVNVKNQ